MAPALSLKVHTGLMNIDQQYKKASNQYWHENTDWTLCSARLLLLPQCFGDWGTCDRVVTWFSNPKREAGTYLRAARVPMATTEVWCHRLAEHVFTSDCVETLPLLNVTYTLSFIIVSRLWRSSPGLAVRADFDASLLWQLNDYSWGNLLPPAQKLWLFLTCLSENSFLKSLKLAMRWLMWITDISLKAAMSEKPLWV